MSGSAPLLRLYGYEPSVYTRAVRIALAELGLGHEWIARDPFGDPASLAGLHPFARVPVLVHGALRLYETAAILTYLEAAFGAPSDDPLVLARTAQVGGIVDAYGYWPLVRQVYAGAVLQGRADADVADGMERAGPVLDALEEIAAEGVVLGGVPDGVRMGRADWHLAPMLDAFRRHGPAASALGARPRLSAWMEAVATRPSLRDTRPESWKVAA